MTIPNRPTVDAELFFLVLVAAGPTDCSLALGAIQGFA